MGGKSQIIRKKKAASRKTERTPKQIAQDRKFWTCGRKRLYGTRAEAEEVASALGQRVYECPYGRHFHTTHRQQESS